MSAMTVSPAAAAAAAGCERKDVPNTPKPRAAFSITAITITGRLGPLAVLDQRIQCRLDLIRARHPRRCIDQHRIVDVVDRANGRLVEAV